MAKAAVLEGRWAQALPYFTTERRGSPVLAFSRVDDFPISTKSFIYNPDMVVVTNPTGMKFVDVSEGIKNGGTILVNTSMPPKDFKFDSGIAVRSIDATEIATAILKTPITNTVMLGALLGVKEIVKLRSIQDAIREEFPGEIGKKNNEAVKLAYDKVKEAI